MAQKKKKAKSRLPRFGLRSALILFLLASLLLAWFGRKLNEAKAEEKFLVQLNDFSEHHEISVRYRYDHDIVKPNLLRRARPQPYGPKWVRSIFGEHVFSRIHGLQFVDDSAIERPPQPSLVQGLKDLDLKSLSSLKQLEFSGFDGLMELSLLADVKGLEDLKMESRTLRSLDGIENLTHLKSIHVHGIFGILNDIKALKNLQNLQMVKLDVDDNFENDENWNALSEKPNLVELSVRAVPFSITASKDSQPLTETTSTSGFIPSPRLAILTFEKLDPGMEDLRCCKEMPKLRSLRIVQSPTLKSLKGIEHCKDLTHLVIHDCANLNDVAGIEQLQHLSVLSISGSPKSISFPELQCRNLKAIALRDIRGFEDLEFLKNMQNLKSLDVSRSELKSLEGIGRLKLLEDLYTSDCRLERIGCKEVTAPLNRLDFSHCGQLVDLNGIDNFKNVKTVLLSGCFQLDRLGDLGHLSSLEYLDLSRCRSLKDLHDLNSVPKLHHVIVNRCSILEDVSALSGVDQLGVFEWSDCPRLKSENVNELHEQFKRLEVFPAVKQPFKQ